jgi:RNA polymerase sigma factor (sigma-70 family)
MPTATAAVDVGVLYERHAPEIHDFLVRTVRDHAAAEDLTQTTFVRLMERGDSVREVDKVRPWLFTVAHNLAVTHVTRRRPTDPIEAAFDIASGEKGPEDEALAIAAAALVWDAAGSLEPRQYAVLDLSVRRGFSVAEIAEVLEITAAHAAVVVHRAREALAQAIRLLVVVRQRRHCARLAELVPAGTDILTPDLRASVDRHMRRCETCRAVGERLTEPDQLLALLPLLPLPLALHAPPLLPGGVPHRTVNLGHAAQKVGHALLQPAALATIAALVLGGTGVGIALHHGATPVGGLSTTWQPKAHGGVVVPRSGDTVLPDVQVPHAELPGIGPVDGSAPSSAPQAIDGGPIVGLAPPDGGSGVQSTGHTPPANAPTPLLDQQIGPVATPLGPAQAHVTVWKPQDGNPSVTASVGGTTLPPPAVAGRTGAVSHASTHTHLPFEPS